MFYTSFSCAMSTKMVCVCSSCTHEFCLCFLFVLQSTLVNRPALGILPPENFPDKLTESLLSVSNRHSHSYIYNADFKLLLILSNTVHLAFLVVVM